MTAYWGVTRQGNFDGHNILHIPGELLAEEPEPIRQAKLTLLAERGKRIRPGRDDKVLASWNGMMLASLAEAACVFGRRDLPGGGCR